MFAIRTPVKDAKRAGPSRSPREEEMKTTTEGMSSRPPTEPGKGDTMVRRSIGEIEARTNTARPKVKSPPKQQLPAKTKPVNIEAEGSPTCKTTKYKSRTTEAKAYLLKAKLQIDKSRNLKSDIKADVLEAVERLYKLVKEAEEARMAGVTSKSSQDIPDQNKPDQHAHCKDDLAAQMKEQVTLLKENNRKIDELKELIELQNGRETYARVVANHCTTKLPEHRETLHSVVVTSTDETETGDEVLDRVRKVVDAKEGWVTVQRVRKAKDRKIIMGFKSKEDQNKVKERLQTGDHLIVEEVKNKKPLLVLREVLQINTDEDIIRALRNQNQSVFQGLKGEESEMEIKYRRKARNPLTSHVVICTSPKIWGRILELGAVHIDLQRVKVADQTPLVQCTRCLGFGHSKRFCKDTTDLCGHCGGPHMRAECPEWLSDMAPACRNCLKAGRDKAEHNAFDRDCPVRIKWDKIARAAVAYC